MLDHHLEDLGVQRVPQDADYAAQAEEEDIECEDYD